MDISPKQQRNMYAFFIGLFAVNVAVTAWNIREAHKLRVLQTELSNEQLAEIKRKKGTEI